ncbi:hypothetical protein F0A16_02840 [Salinicola corii]|uniref:NinB family protein n=1 Tax=Salinicola corii TaxID=2606937 RepID=A0A640WJN4_9GAMM|nr:hypothetical protein [Salinicola corii]KAA0020742.1 hypothetical protein F0A16_02840 [Salinicola corii]
MTKEVVIRVDSIKGAQFALSRASAAISKGIEAGPIEVVLRRPGKSRLQEEKYHAMIGDIHRQCFRGYSVEGVKAVLVNQFAHEMEEQGTPLSKPGERVWDWVLQSPVYVRPSTTKFRKAEAAAFMEFLYATGAELEVAWSEPALKAYSEFKEAA